MLAGFRNRGLRDLSSTMARMRASLGPAGPDFFGRWLAENNRRYFRRTNARWNVSSVDGRTPMATFRIRLGLRNSDPTPHRSRAPTVKFEARLGERRSTSSCCLSRRFSAMTARTPPGPHSFAAVTARWRRVSRTSFIRETDSVRHQAPRTVAPVLDSARELRTRDAQVDRSHSRGPTMTDLAATVA